MPSLALLVTLMIVSVSVFFYGAAGYLPGGLTAGLAVMGGSSTVLWWQHRKARALQSRAANALTEALRPLELAPPATATALALAAAEPAVEAK